MKIRHSLIVVCTIALTANLSVAAFASSSNSANSYSGVKLQYVGFRSHGEPVYNWQSGEDNSNSGGNDIDTDPVRANLGNADQWFLNHLASQLPLTPRKGYSYTVGSSAVGPISCHGSCTTLTGTVSLIPVWVGNWAASDITTWNSLLGNVVTSLGSGSANSVALPGHVFNTNTLYYTSQGLTPPSLRWVPNTSITEPTATNVSDSQVTTFINEFIAANPSIVPAGTTPVFMYIGANSTLLTSGFGTTYCGWHSYDTTSGGANIPIIAFQNFASIYNGKCSAQATSPNGNVPLDAMASVMVHEIDESLQDPFLSAWYDATGAESADKCVWTFGTVSKVGTARYNVVLGSTKYLIQQDWLENNLVTPTGTATGTACSVTG